MMPNLKFDVTVRRSFPKRMFLSLPKIQQKFTYNSKTRSDIWHAEHLTVHCGHTMSLTTVIMLHLMYSFVTIFGSNYYVSVCTVRHLLHFWTYKGRTESHHQHFLHANWEQQTKESSVVDETSCCVILECLVTSISCITCLVSLLTKWPTTICRFASVL